MGGGEKTTKMSIALNTRFTGSKEKEPIVHNVQCELEYDGDAKVDNYFTTAIRKTDEGKGER